MYPKLWGASGLAYPELIERLLDLAVERHDAESGQIHRCPRTQQLKRWSARSDRQPSASGPPFSVS